MEAFLSALELHIPGCCFQAKNNKNNELVSCILNQSYIKILPSLAFQNIGIHIRKHSDG